MGGLAVCPRRIAATVSVHGAVLPRGFTKGCANSPVCSPTRLTLMAGRYQYRLRGAAEEPISISIRTPGSTLLGLDSARPTLPSLL